MNNIERIELIKKIDSLWFDVHRKFCDIEDNFKGEMLEEKFKEIDHESTEELIRLVCEHDETMNYEELRAKYL